MTDSLIFCVMGYNRLMISEKNNIDHEELRITRELELVNDLVESENLLELSRLLEIDLADLELSLKCVGRGRRKAGSNPDITPQTHFSHMARVAMMVKQYFPDDIVGRRLAVLHDAKEEATMGMEKLYLESDLSPLIDMMTEEMPTEDEIDFMKSVIPAGFDPIYFSKYKTFIGKLHTDWHIFKSLELCDRLDGTSSLSYLLNPKYTSRLKLKALESLGRIWATIDRDSGDIVVEKIKNNCRTWFDIFGVTENEVEVISGFFVDEHSA